MIRCQISRPSLTVSMGCVWERREAEKKLEGCSSGSSCLARQCRGKASGAGQHCLTEEIHNWTNSLARSKHGFFTRIKEPTAPLSSPCGLHVATSMETSVDGADDSQSGSQSMVLFKLPASSLIEMSLSLSLVVCFEVFPPTGCVYGKTSLRVLPKPPPSPAVQVRGPSSPTLLVSNDAKNARYPFIEPENYEKTFCKRLV